MIIGEDLTPVPAESRRFRNPIPRRLALVDARGTIVAVSRDVLTDEGSGDGFDRLGPGMNYLEVCRQRSAASSVLRQAVSGIQEVLKGRSSSFALDYACHTRSGLAHFRLNAVPVVCGSVRAAITHTDITDLQVSKQKDFKRLQQFARRLIHAQEEERQKISREIHDDLGNKIALISLSVSRIMKHVPSEKADSGVPGLRQVLDDIADLSTSLRNLSHLLHPAPLRCLGISAALKEFLYLFMKRSGIQADAVVPPDVPRLPGEIELCIFRVAQECLNNVAKHSGADKVRVVLEHTSRRIQLTVSDRGRGFVRSEAMQRGGLGLLGMEERALSVWGRLTTKTSPGAGTEIRLTIPLPEDWLAVTAQ